MYYSFLDEDGNESGSFEVFHLDDQDATEWTELKDEDEPEYTTGWYWWACFPGCLPDGEPIGPFPTEDEAIADARNN